MIVGLTGGIASGKSTVTNMFRDFGAYVVDADIWARKVVEPGSPGLAEIAEVFHSQFGVNVLQADGTLNRPAMGQVVFSNEEARRVLNQITHPRIRQGMRQETEDYFRDHPKEPILWDVPLLFEGETRQLVDLTVLVYVNQPTQLRRLMERDGYSEGDAVARIKSQMSIEEKRKMADFIIDNMGSLEQTREQVQRVWHNLQERAREGVERATFGTPE